MTRMTGEENGMASVSADKTGSTQISSRADIGVESCHGSDESALQRPSFDALAVFTVGCYGSCTW
jgi:hypothetical protein